MFGPPEREYHSYTIRPSLTTKKAFVPLVAKSSRSEADVSASLHSLKMAAQRDENLMPSVLEAVGNCATEGEIMSALRETYGEYVDPGVF